MANTNIPSDRVEQEHTKAIAARRAGIQAKQAVIFTPIIVLGAVFCAFASFSDPIKQIPASAPTSVSSPAAPAVKCSASSCCPATLQRMGSSCSMHTTAKASCDMKGLGNAGCCEMDSPAPTNTPVEQVEATTAIAELPADANSAVNVDQGKTP